MWLDRFNNLRRNSGMSLDELSERSGVPKGTLAKITSGITKSPALETMRSLVYAMGYTLNDLEEPKNTPTPSTDDAGVLTKEELSRISAAMDQLNEEGRERVVEYAEDLAAGGRFKKPCAASVFAVTFLNIYKNHPVWG